MDMKRCGWFYALFTVSFHFTHFVSLYFLHLNRWTGEKDNAFPFLSPNNALRTENRDGTREKMRKISLWKCSELGTKTFIKCVYIPSKFPTATQNIKHSLFIFKYYFIHTCWPHLILISELSESKGIWWGIEFSLEKLGRKLDSALSLKLLVWPNGREMG